MTRPHDPQSAGGLRQYTFSAWTRSRNHQTDAEVPPGETRPPDRVIQLHGASLVVTLRGGRAVIVDAESGCPVPIIEMIEEAYRAGMRASGVLIFSQED